nr:1923_t:CDS:2 [Entrophospora candida]CAG8465670.1 9963_t:CDS:2 [Entrophospora candida]
MLATTLTSFKVVEKIDDLLTDILIDQLFLWFNTFKLNPNYEMVDVSSEVILGIIRKNVLEKVKLDQACEELLSHAKRYLQMYQANAGYEITETKRYLGSSKREACIVATKDFNEGDELRLCIGALVPLTSHEENKLEGGRDFSIMWSQRKDVMCLLLGPARFMNHDCKPNTTFIAAGQNVISFKFTRSVKIGEELTSYYGDDYFGEGNCECLCATCERLKKGGYKPESAIPDEENIGSINRVVYNDGIGKVVRRSARNHTNNNHSETPLIQSQIVTPRPIIDSVADNHQDEANLIDMDMDIDRDSPRTEIEESDHNYSPTMLSDKSTDNVATALTSDQSFNYNSTIHRIPNNVTGSHSSILLSHMGLMSLKQVNEDLKCSSAKNVHRRVPDTNQKNLPGLDPIVSYGTISESASNIISNAGYHGWSGSRIPFRPLIRILNGVQIMVKKTHASDKSNSPKNVMSSTGAVTSDVTAAAADVNDQETKLTRKWCRICDDMFESSKNTMRCLRCTRHLKLFTLDWPCRRLKRTRKDDNQKTTTKADSSEGSASRPVKRFKADITMDHQQISGTDRTDWSPYPIENIDVKIIKYKRANGQVSHAYEYCYNENFVRWDKDSGFVHLNPLKRSFKNSLRNLEKLKCWDQTWNSRRHIIIGGNIKYQGTWLPYDLTKKLSIEMIGENEAFLIPLFGPNYGQEN